MVGVSKLELRITACEFGKALQIYSHLITLVISCYLPLYTFLSSQNYVKHFTI